MDEPTRLPTGTVTFLLTDMEGSTRLLERSPTATLEALQRHHELLAEAIERHGGIRPVEQGEGDSVVAVFTRAPDAVACAVDAQRALAAQQWPDGLDVRVRMAVHTGVAVLRAAGRYSGIAIHRCARVRGIAHGGQVLVTASTAELVRDLLPGGVELVDLGDQRLRDLSRPERIFQLVGPGLQRDFPPLRGLDAVVNNLPLQLTAFVGREEEMHALAGLLASSRLVTLAGAGGVGKTRLALQAVAEGAGTSDRVWVVELAALSDAGAVASFVNSTIGGREQPGRAVFDVLVEQIGSEPTMLLLDNCEHVVEPVARLVSELLAASASLVIVATSREPLGVPGEVVYRVPSLRLPTAADLPEQIDETDAVRLFVDRARMARPSFALTTEVRGPVVEICRRVDGLPLAIELAAARVRMLSPSAIATGLDDRFRLLTGGGRTLLARQQTLRASIDWSFALLSEPEQLVLARLAVFSDGFTLGGAEHVASGGIVESYDVLDLLTRLVDKSMVLAEPLGDGVRYRMLSGIQEFALERLAASVEITAARHRHLSHFASLCAGAQAALEGPEIASWVARLKLERANLNLAFAWASEQRDAHAMWAMCGALTLHWMSDGQFSEARRWFEACCVHDDVPIVEQLAARWGAAHLAFYAADYDRGVALASTARDAARQEGDDRYLARSLSSLAGLDLSSRPTAAVRTLLDAAELASGAGDQWCACDATQAAAYGLLSLGQTDEALASLDAALPLARRLDNTQMLAWDLIGRGWHSGQLGDLDAARRSFEAGRRHAERTGDPSILGFAILTQTATEVTAGDAAAWKPIVDEMLTRCMRVGAGSAVPGLASAALETAVAVDDIVGAEAIFGDYSEVIVEYTPSAGSPFLQAAAIAALRRGDLVAARHRATLALELARTIGSRVSTASSSTVLALVELISGDPTAAEDLLHEALPVVSELARPLELIDTLNVLAAVAATREHPLEALRLWGAADAEADRRGVRHRPPRRVIETYRAAVLAEVGAEQSAAVTAEGRSLTLDEAVSYARRARGERKRPTTGWDSLTPTETQVASLVAEGLSNAKIGERLFISAGTVKTHLAHIYAKLGLNNRTEVATAHAHRFMGHP